MPEFAVQVSEIGPLRTGSPRATAFTRGAGDAAAGLPPITVHRRTPLTDRETAAARSVASRPHRSVRMTATVAGVTTALECA
jgi:hypothetical protein